MVDYCCLNQCTVPDFFPTPRIVDVMDGLARSKVFSTLDAAQAYHNVPIEPSSQDLTAFVYLFGSLPLDECPLVLGMPGQRTAG